MLTRRADRQPTSAAPRVASFLGAFVYGAFAASAFAGPQGGKVVAGQGTISNPDANTTLINQSSRTLRLNWESFDVAAQENVKFVQPSSTATALNRIFDQNPSQIFGTIEANGRVFLINPNGLIFGQTARVNVGSFVASTLDIVDLDPNTGHYSFANTNGTAGAVLNSGQIRAADGGSVTLLGTSVLNNGLIVANHGTVNLGAGSAATLDFFGDGLLRFQVDDAVVGNASGAAAAVDNQGSIEADGGQVLMTARAAQGVFERAVNNDGIVRANRIDNSGGVIRLVGPEGTVINSGTLDASGADAASTGGTVQVLGERVGLFGDARVDVSGDTGGGTALIGGDFQGSNPDVLNAQRTYVGPDASISADARVQGDGGRVIVWSDDFTRYFGSISALGRAAGGNGGFAEVSGKHNLTFEGDAWLGSPLGAAGTLLLDPTAITIVAMGGADNAQVTDGLYAFADGATAVSGFATIDADAVLDVLTGMGAGGTSVVLQATDDIVVNAAIEALGAMGAANSGLTLQAGDDITVNANLSADKDVVLQSGVTRDSANQSVTPVNTASGSRDITIKDGVTITSGTTVAFTAGFADAVPADSTTGNVNLGTTATGGVALTAPAVILTARGGNIVANPNNLVTADTLTATADAIGATGARLNTDVDSLIATAAGGSIFIADSGTDINGVGITLTNVAAANIDIVENDGDLAFGTVDAGAGTVTLAASNGAIVGNAGHLVTADTFSATAATAIGTAGARINTSVTTLNATANNGGVFVTDSGVDLSGVGISLANVSGNTVDVVANDGNLAVGTVSAGAGTVTLAANAGAITGNAGNLLTAGTLAATANTSIGAAGARVNTSIASLNATANNGGIFITEGNGILLANVAATGAGNNVDIQATAGDITLGTVNAAGGTATLTASTGAIVGNAGNSVTADTLSANAGTSIGAAPGTRINTNVNTLNASTTNGGIFITEGAGISLNNVTTAGAASGVDVTASTGDIAVGTVNAGAGTVTLAANGGAITGNAGNLLTAGTLSATAATSIGAAPGQRLNTNINSLTATANNGGIFITEGNGITLTNVSATGAGSAVDVQANAGNVTLGTVSTGIGLGTVTLTASTGAIVGNAGNDVTADTLSANAGTSIGAPGARINTNINTLNANANNGGVFVTEGNGILLSNVTAAGASAAVDVQANSGDITLGTVNAGTGTVTLCACVGAISANLGNLVTAGTFSATAGTSIGAPPGTRLNTSVDTLNATANNGSILISESSGIILGNVSAAGAGSGVDVFANAGDITAANVAASGTVLLRAQTGSILDDGDAGGLTVIQAGGVSLFAANNVGSISDFALIARGTTQQTGESLDLQLNPGAVSGQLQVTTTALNSQLNLNLVTNNVGGRWVVPGGFIRLGNLGLGSPIGNSAQVIVQSADDLNLSLWDQTSFVNGNNNTAQIAFRAGRSLGTTGTLTLNNAAKFTDVAPQQLSLYGATDIVGNGGTRALTLATTDTGATGGLFFYAGTPGGAYTLTTTTNRLDAQIGANQNLTIGEATDLTLANVLLGPNARFELTTNGAILDDGDNTTVLRAGTAFLQAFGNGVIGTAGATGQLDTQVTTFERLLADNGGAYIDNLGSTTLQETALSAGPDLQINVRANGADAGNLVLGRFVGAINGATLTAAGAVTDTAVAANETLHATTLTINAGSIGAAGNALDIGAGGTLNATAANGAALATSDAGALTVTNLQGGTGVASVSTVNGDLTVANAAGAVTLNAGGAGSDLTLGTINAGAGNATLSAGGDIVDTGTTPSVTANQLTILGAGSADLDTAVATLNASGVTGALTVRDQDQLTVAQAASSSAVNISTVNGALTVTNASGPTVTLNAGGAGSALTLGNVNAGAGTATLGAGGAITDAGPTASVTAGTLTIANAASMNVHTAVANLNAANVTGALTLNNQGALTVSPANAGGALNISTVNGALNVANATGSSVTLTAGGANALTLGTVNAGAGTATLAAGGAINDGAGTAASISAGQLTITNAGSVNLDTAVSTLTASSTGAITVHDADQLTVNNASAGGLLTVSTTNGALTVTNATGAGATLTAGGAGSGITLGTLNGGSGAVSLTAGGAITDGTTGTSLTGGALTLNGASIGTSGNHLTTSVASLAATATNGGIFLDEANDLQLNGITASGTGNTAVITAGGTVTQNANIATSGGLLQLEGSAITMAANTESTSQGGNINYVGHTGNVLLGGVSTGSATAGTVKVVAAGDITRASDPGPADVTGGRIELRAGGGNGSTGNVGSVGSPIRIDTASPDTLLVLARSKDVVNINFVSLAATTVNVLEYSTTPKDFFNVNFDFLGNTNLADQGSAFAATSAAASSAQAAVARQGVALEAETTYVDWGAFDPNISLFGTVSPAMRLPPDQAEEEEAPPAN